MDEMPFNEPYKWGRLKIFPWHDWGFLVDRQTSWNWIDITWVLLKTEKANYKEAYDLTIGVLGFCVSIEWYYGKERNRL